jgi:hypothetical protein
VIGLTLSLTGLALLMQLTAEYINYVTLFPDILPLFFDFCHFGFVLAASTKQKRSLSV